MYTSFLCHRRFPWKPIVESGEAAWRLVGVFRRFMGQIDVFVGRIEKFTQKKQGRPFEGLYDTIPLNSGGFRCIMLGLVFLSFSAPRKGRIIIWTCRYRVAFLTSHWSHFLVARTVEMNSYY